ncbi:hypothetical protein [Amycolatopsis jiangsuensis]|uniref:hypothetical protein n=1 Tax=Amycolatopsis jiangsuensis TaxID=1181879 RepID=UPI00363D111D
MAVFAVAIVLGGTVGFAVADLSGFGDIRWLGSETSAHTTTVGALVAGVLAGRLVLGGTGTAFTVSAPEPLRGWPGTRFGAGALVAAPLLLLAGEILRSGHHYFFPAQLAAMVGSRGTMLTSYALYTAGLVLLLPAFLALAGQIRERRPGLAFWAATLAVIGGTVRIFQEGINFLALQLVDAQGLDVATTAVGDTYGAWYVLAPLNGATYIAWPLLAIGAYRADVLGWVPALGVAFMSTHYSGVLKGSDVNTLTGAVLLAAVFVPLGFTLWRRAEPLSRKGFWSSVAALGLLAALYLAAVLSDFAPIG